jgi:ATP-binding cassette, subfamily B, bacterial
MKFPFYRQQDSMDCGPTCLKMIARHYGKTYALQLLRYKSQIGKEGVNMLGISDAAESIGFRTQAVKLNYKTLSTSALLPCILHLNKQHFVVLYKIRRKTVYLADPTHGLVKLDQDELLKRWISDLDEEGLGEGVALLLEPTSVFYEWDEAESSHAREARRHEDRLFGKIFGYILPHKQMLLQLIVGLVVASLLQLVLPFLASSVIDIGVNTGNIQFVHVVLMAQIALFVGRITADFLRNWILLHIGIRINIAILTDFIIKLMKLPASFFDSKRTGDILQRMNDHQRIESFLTGSSVGALFSIATLVVFSIVLAIFNTYIFLVFVISSFFYCIWTVAFLKRRKDLDYKRFDISAREQSSSIQIVQGMQEIKLNGVEKQTRWAWERLQARLFRLNIKSFSLDQWQRAGASFINESKNIFITFMSAEAAIGGRMTLGTMLAIQYIIGQLNGPIEQMVGFTQSWQNAKISMDRLNDVHKLEDEEPAHRNFIRDLPITLSRQLTGGRAFNASSMSNCIPDSDVIIRANESAFSSSELSGKGVKRDFIGICFSNLGFIYPGAGNAAILSNINLNIPKGKMTAIVGKSGSGKTTLLKLLLKFYEPTTGDIMVDRISLSTISHTFWRSHFGVVMQESFIFSDTVARNIAVGEDNINMEKLLNAMEVANLEDVISTLPSGFNTKIGSEGTGISMGQRQRILIARAVYRNPEFILFDEATNSLDANNESVIMKKLQFFFKGRTVIIVAHRLSTVKDADQIIVVDKGTIVETGTHPELLALNGEYYSLVKNQLSLD